MRGGGGGVELRGPPSSSAASAATTSRAISASALSDWCELRFVPRSTWAMRSIPIRRQTSTSIAISTP